MLGSASPDLLRQSPETLAGRIGHFELSGPSLLEVGNANLDRAWLRGGFPRSYTARSSRASWQWRDDFVRSFVERDVPQLEINIPAATLGRFWAMLVHTLWRTHQGAEIDLVVQRGGRLRGFEIKRTIAPRVTAAMRIAMADLRPTRIDIIHAGAETFPLAPRIMAVAASRLLEDVNPAR